MPVGMRAAPPLAERRLYRAPRAVGPGAAAPANPNINFIGGERERVKPPTIQPRYGRIVQPTPVGAAGPANPKRTVSAHGWSKSAAAQQHWTRVGTRIPVGATPPANPTRTTSQHGWLKTVVILPRWDRINMPLPTQVVPVPATDVRQSYRKPAPAQQRWSRVNTPAPPQLAQMSPEVPLNVHQVRRQPFLKKAATVVPRVAGPPTLGLVITPAFQRQVRRALFLLKKGRTAAPEVAQGLPPPNVGQRERVKPVAAMQRWRRINAPTPFQQAQASPEVPSSAVHGRAKVVLVQPHWDRINMPAPPQLAQMSPEVPGTTFHRWIKQLFVQPRYDRIIQPVPPQQAQMSPAVPSPALRRGTKPPHIMHKWSRVAIPALPQVAQMSPKVPNAVPDLPRRFLRSKGKNVTPEVAQPLPVESPARLKLTFLVRPKARTVTVSVSLLPTVENVNQLKRRPLQPLRGKSLLPEQVLVSPSLEAPRQIAKRPRIRLKSSVGTTFQPLHQHQPEIAVTFKDAWRGLKFWRFLRLPRIRTVPPPFVPPGPVVALDVSGITGTQPLDTTAITGTQPLSCGGITIQ